MGGRAPTKTTTATSMTTTLSDSATGVGDSTLVTGTMTNTATDVRPVTLTSGTSTFTATAQSTGDSVAYAAVETYADVEGEDLLITANRTSTVTNTSGDQTTMTTTSNTSMLAIELEHVDLPTGLITVSTTEAQEGSCDPATLDGNVATLDVSASATGEETYASADALLVTMEGSRPLMPPASPSPEFGRSEATWRARGGTQWISISTSA